MTQPGKYFTTSWIRYYQIQARSFFYHTEVDEEDAAQDAQLALHERLGKQSPEKLTDAFVRVTFKNLLRDLYRKHFGRPRPPQWVERLGVLWKRIYELFCMEQLPKEEIAILLEEGRNESTDYGDIPRMVDRAVDKLKAEEACPKPRQRPLSLDAQSDDEGPVIEISDGVDSQDHLETAEVHVLIQGILWDVDDEPDHTKLSLLSDHVASRWQALGKQLDISDEERLMLRMIYQEQLSVAEVARLLGKEAHNVRRPVQRVCRRIRELFDENNLQLEDLYC